MADHSIYQKFMIFGVVPHQKSRVIHDSLLCLKMANQVSPPLDFFLSLISKEEKKNILIIDEP